MMEFWAIIAIIGATAQSLRTVCQKILIPRTGELGASFSRFVYGILFAWIWTFAICLKTGASLPEMNMLFLVFVGFAAILQIAFTILLIMMFNHRNYAIGIALSKTEILQTALLEAFLIGYVASFSTLFAIIIGLVGIALLSYQKIESANGHKVHLFFSPSHFLGIGSGAALALANIFYFKATILLEGDLLLGASFTAAIAITMQTIILGSYLILRQPEQLMLCLANWRIGIFIGITAAVSTAAWFMAFAMFHLGAVRAIGQIELIISILFSWLFLKEKITLLEVIGISVLGISIILVLLYA
jgi:drug/metabolite transporter (DMT)-like permease